MSRRKTLTALSSAAAIFSTIATGAVSSDAAAASSSLPAPIAAYTSQNLISSQWGLAAMNVPQAWQITQGANARVAVIDSGLQYSEEFAGRVDSPGRWNGSTVTPIDSQQLEDLMGHGTHVSGIISAANNGTGVTGVAPLSTIIPIDVSDTIAGGTETEFAYAIASALAYAVRNNADIVNMSLGSEIFDIDKVANAQRICRAVEQATKAGVLVIVAAGNSGERENPLAVPAGCPGAVSVTALNSSLLPASWSSADSTVQLAAPGENILSTWTTEGENAAPLGLAIESGTSMAAPAVAGVAALIVSQNPDWGRERILAALQSSAYDITPVGKDPYSGYGGVDALAAVTASQPQLFLQPTLTHTLVSDVNYEYFGYDECGPCAYLTWKSSGLPVSSYTVHWVNGAGNEQHTMLPSDTLRHVTVGARPGDWLSVTAAFSDGRTVTTLPQRVRADPSSFTLLSLEAEWEGRNIVRVTWDASTTLPNNLSTSIFLFAGMDPVAEQKDFSWKDGKQSVLITIPPRAVGLPLTPVLTVSSPTSESIVSASGEIIPSQYPLSAEVVAAGAARLAVVVRMDSLWNIQAQQRAVGETVVITQGKKTLGTGVMLGDGTATILIPRIACSDENRPCRFSLSIPNVPRLPSLLTSPHRFSLPILYS